MATAPALALTFDHCRVHQSGTAGWRDWFDWQKAEPAAAPPPPLTLLADDVPPPPPNYLPPPEHGMYIMVDPTENIYDVAINILMGLHKNNVMYTTVDDNSVSIANQPRLAAILGLFGIVQLEGAHIKPISFQFADDARRGKEGGSGCTRELWRRAIDQYKMLGAI